MAASSSNTEVGGEGEATQKSINGAMLYHEVQESKLCAMHCVNTALQGPFFSEFDLAALAEDLDRTEHRMLTGDAGDGDGGGGDTTPIQASHSHNVSLDGNFSIQVLQKALEVWDLHTIPLDSPDAEAAQKEPEKENAFICHLLNHWFSIRKVNGEWYNFNSLHAAPENLSKFYLSAYLDSLRGSGWSIFVVRGNFPSDCPMSSSEASNSYGQWLLPEDAEKITKTCNPASSKTQKERGKMQITGEGTDMLFSTEDEDADLKAAIAASLMHSSGVPETQPSTSGEQKKNTHPEKRSGEMLQPFDEVRGMLFGIEDDEDADLKAAIAASLMHSSGVPETQPRTLGNERKKSYPEKQQGETQLEDVETEMLFGIEDQGLKAAVAASLKDSPRVPGTQPTTSVPGTPAMTSVPGTQPTTPGDEKKKSDPEEA